MRLWRLNWRKNVALVAQWIPPRQANSKAQFQAKMHSIQFSIPFSFLFIQPVFDWSWNLKLTAGFISNFKLKSGWMKAELEWNWMNAFRLIHEFINLQFYVFYLFLLAAYFLLLFWLLWNFNWYRSWNCRIFIHFKKPINKYTGERKSEPGCVWFSVSNQTN